MRALVLLLLVFASAAAAADISTGMPQHPWDFKIDEFVSTCSVSHAGQVMSSIKEDDDMAGPRMADVMARLSFCQGLVVGVSEIVQASARLGLLKGGCRMDGVSFQSVYATIAALYWKTPKEYVGARASTVIMFALANEYPCEATGPR